MPKSFKEDFEDEFFKEQQKVINSTEEFNDLMTAYQNAMTHTKNLFANNALAQATSNGSTGGAPGGTGGLVVGGTSPKVSSGTISVPNTGGYFSPKNPPIPNVGISLPYINSWQTSNLNAIDSFVGVVRERLEEYLRKRSTEIVRGRYQKQFLTDILGLNLEELKNDWFMLKDGDNLTEDRTLCSKIHGRPLPLMHKCNKGGQFYSKTSTDMANSKIWCDHCEKDLPDDLFTMLGITYVL